MAYSITTLKRWGRVQALCATIVLFCFSFSALASMEDIYIGVLAKRGVEHALKKWGPTADYLNEQVPGHNFHIVPLGFEEIIPAVINKDIQFVLANPSFYVELEAKYGVSRIATLINNCNEIPCTQFGGVIFTRRDNKDLKYLSDLKGQRIMAVKETSLGGYQMARQLLKRHKIDVVTDMRVEFGITHDAVVHAVLDGRVPVGTVRTDTLERMAREGKIDLADIQVINAKKHRDFGYLASTPLFPEWPFARLAHTPRDHSDAIAAALLSMPSTHEAARASAGLGWTVPSNYQAVHELLKELRLGPYQHFGKIDPFDIVTRYWYWLLITLMVFIGLVAIIYHFRRLNARLRDSQRKLEEIRDNLAQRVVERTEDLSKSKAELEAIFNAQSDVLVFADVERHIRSVNPAFIKEFGYQPDEVIGKKTRVLYESEDDYDQQGQQRYSPGATATDSMYEVSYRRKDGSSFIGETMGRRIADKEGEMLGFIGVIRDVTERKRAERALQLSEEMNRAVLNSALDCIVTMDHNGLILDFNPAAERSFGYQRQDVIGQEMSEKLVPPNMREHHQAGFHRFLATRDSRIINRRIETDAMRSDGGEFPVELAITVFEIDNNPVFTAHIRDITERRRHESLLMQNEARLAEAQRIANMGSWEWDIEENILHWSDETYRIFGLNPQQFEATYDAFVEHIHPEDRDMVTHAVAGALDNKTAYSIDHRIVMADGRVSYVHEQGEASYDLEGNPLRMVGTVQDITDRKQIEEDLLLAATSFETHEAIMITDVKGNILRVNRAFSTITGYQSGEVLGKNPKILSSGRHDKAFFKQLWKQILEIDYWNGEIWNRRKNGEIYPEWLSIAAVRNKDNETTHFVAHFQDITARKEAEAKIKRQAYYDALTELPNRRLLNDRIEQSLYRSRRRGSSGAIIFLDLDHFKVINDSLGHHVGDLVVQEIAQRLISHIREEDTAARLGGDEFVVLLPELGAEMEDAFVEAQVVVNKIQAAIAEPVHVQNYELHVTASLGIALFPENHDSVEDILRQADIAMYRAKDLGRNTFQFYLPSMQMAARERLLLEHDLRRAIANNELQLYYQPQVSHEREVIGAECLLRWIHAERGFVSPADFIPVAEDTGLILEIGEWVLREACERLAEYIQRDVSTSFKRLAVNVSPVQFKQHDFVERVSAIVRETGVDPHRLELEFTEGMLISQIEDTIEKIQELKQLGIHFSIDDFGTGYSSLTYLKQLPVDKLKIDQSFVNDISSDPSDAAIVDTIIAMTRHLSLDVIAEGVETEEQLAFLRENGCNSYQGYLFYRPLPQTDFEQVLGLAEAVLED